MPRTQTVGALGLCLFVTAAVCAQGQSQNSPPRNWPPSVYARPADGFRQASHQMPVEPSVQTGTPGHAAQPVAPLPPRSTADAALPLAARGKASTNQSASGAGAALLTTAGSLALVLCLFFAAAWVLRKGNPHTLAALPGEVVEVLGRAALPGRQQMHLVRCGHKLVLVAVSSTGAETLTEITDPLEVDRLCGLCRQAHPHSSTAAFRNLLHQFGVDSAGEEVPAAARSYASRKPRAPLASEDRDA